MQAPPARRRAAPWLLASLALWACAGPPRDTPTRAWLGARGADLMDVFGLRAALGPGLGFMVRLTEHAQLGFVYRGVEQGPSVGSAGTRPRSVPCVMIGTIGRYGGVWFDSHQEVALPGWSLRESPRRRIQREVVAGAVPLNGEDDRWRLSLGISVHAFLAGFEAELRPLEAFDFAAGWAGYDPSEDDVPASRPSPDEGLDAAAASS